MYLLLTCGIYAVADFIDDYFKFSFSLKQFAAIIEFVILICIGLYAIIKTKDKKSGIIFLIVMTLIVIVSDVILKWIEFI